LPSLAQQRDFVEGKRFLRCTGREGLHQQGMHLCRRRRRPVRSGRSFSCSSFIKNPTEPKFIP
jgi:hypothetical protein